MANKKSENPPGSGVTKTEILISLTAHFFISASWGAKRDIVFKCVC